MSCLCGDPGCDLPVPSIETIVSVQADPQPYKCEFCGQGYSWPISAALCCDELSNTLGYD